MDDKNKSHGDFWDLSSLLPKKRPPVMRQPSTDTEPVTLEINAQVNLSEPTQVGESASLSLRFREVPSARAAYAAPKSQERRYGSQSIPKKDTYRPRPTAESVLEYAPRRGLIKTVKIMRWPTSYSFYEQFRADAIRCRRIEGKPCPAVPFFSYTPQYRQMSREQLDYYFYWRSECRRGVFLEADFAYVLLYIYEIINVYSTVDERLKDTEDKSSGLGMLCSLWLSYREKYKALDKYLSEWLPDYCLIHRLPAPLEKLSPILPDIMKATSFCEFFMSSDPLSPESLISLSSDYDWHRSKYVAEGSDELKKSFKTHIEGALRAAVESGDESFSSSASSPVRASRDAFCGSLCAHSIKRRIDVEYTSFSRGRELRAAVTSAVKYAENKLRAHYAIKSRLKADNLSDTARSAIDAYFASVYPTDRHYASKSDAAREEERYYEAMYGALSVGVDGDEARKLELESWSVTERLTESDEAEAAEASSSVPDNSVTVELVPEPDANASALSALHLCVLRALRGGNAELAGSLCREAGRYLDEIISEINSHAVDTFGDIIIEDGEVIEDYSAEVAEMLGEN